MITCPVTKNKNPMPPVPCVPKKPAKASTAPAKKTSSVQHGTPSSSLKLITGGKSQSKPVVKNGTVVFSDQKIQAQAKPKPKEDPAQKAKARKFINDFGMIQLAKSSGKDVKRSVWGHSKIPTHPMSKHTPAKR